MNYPNKYQKNCGIFWLNQNTMTLILSYIPINMIFKKIIVINKEFSKLIRINIKFWIIYHNYLNEEI